MSDTKLLPCPCCGKDDYAEYHTDHETMLVNIICNADDGGCGLSTGYGEDRSEAFKIWNTRTPPEGYVLVPVEPTPSMVLNGADAVAQCELAMRESTTAERCYKAMLSAAEVKPAKVELPTVILPEGTDKFKG